MDKETISPSVLNSGPIIHFMMLMQSARGRGGEWGLTNNRRPLTHRRRASSSCPAWVKPSPLFRTFTATWRQSLDTDTSSDLGYYSCKHVGCLVNKHWMVRKCPLSQETNFNISRFVKQKKTFFIKDHTQVTSVYILSDEGKVMSYQICPNLKVTVKIL